MNTVLVASGTSKNKLNFATNFITVYLEERNLDVIVIGENIYEVNLSEINPTIIVAIGPHSFGEKFPLVDGTPFITKINMEQCCEEIINHLLNN